MVDAGVGIKLFLAEEHSEVADRLFEELGADPPSRFYVPDLFFIECGNILWKYARNYGYGAAEARQDIIDLQSLHLQSVSTSDLLPASFDLAIAYDLTAYDSCYAALAQYLALPLVTADPALIRKLEGSGIDARALAEIDVP